MAVAGLPTPCPDHARRMVTLALDMLKQVREFRRQNQVELSIRIGINTGPVVAGVIGSTKFIYDLWGDTVNIASRMESHGIADTIQVTRGVVEKLGNEFAFHQRGIIELKGRGTIETWLLSLGEAAAQQS
jgi:class 3 adenylate cyclase